MANETLSGPKSVEIESAIEKSVKYNSALLKGIISSKNPKVSPSKKVELETAFVRLLTDFKTDRIETTFSNLELGADEREEIIAELRKATETITLPISLLKKTYNVSAHRQQRLYDRVRERIRQQPDKLDELIPALPTDAGAFDSYVEILKICHEIILGIDTTRNLHRFHALLAIRWMSGWSLPRIISAAIKRQRDIERRKPPEARREIDTRKIIREMLEIIEDAIRFQTIRLFGCYRSVLEYALSDSGSPELTGKIPDVELFLEVGASNATTVSLISLGLSRAVAIKVNGARSEMDPQLDRNEALAWLTANLQNLQSFGLSQLQIEEVLSVLRRSRS